MTNELVKANPVTVAEAFPFEREIETWDIETAVQKIKPKVEAYKRSAAELAKDLFIAHEALARHGGDRRSENADVLNWGQFLDIIGLSRKMAAVYMRLYDPVTDTVQNPDTMIAAKPDRMQLDDGGHEQRVVHAMETGERLKGWTDKDEHEYKKRLANRHFTEMANKWGSKKIKLNYKGRDYFAEAMQNGKQYSKIVLNSKEQSLAQFEVFNHLDEYLRTFDEPADRLAAAYNVGLKMREIVNEMASIEEDLASYSGPGEN